MSQVQVPPSSTYDRLVRFFRTPFIVGISTGLLTGFTWTETLHAEDVYNFYFQKGEGPHTVIQGGNASTPLPARTPEQAASVTSPVASTTAVAPPQQPESKPTINHSTVLLGYSRVADNVSAGAAFTLGYQYNFNRYVGARGSLSLRNGHLDDEFLWEANKNNLAHKLGGSLAFVFTPIRVELVGHRLLEASALVGASTHRNFVDDYSAQTKIGVSPFAGASALLAINDNVGIEVNASKSLVGSQIGAALALQF